MLTFNTYDVALRFTGKHGPNDAKQRWFFGNDITAQDRAQAISLATDTLREEIPTARVVAAFADDITGAEIYPARIGLVHGE